MKISTPRRLSSIARTSGLSRANCRFGQRSGRENNLDFDLERLEKRHLLTASLGNLPYEVGHESHDESDGHEHHGHGHPSAFESFTEALEIQQAESNVYRKPLVEERGSELNDAAWLGLPRTSHDENSTTPVSASAANMEQDIPGDATTQQQLAVGESFQSVAEVEGDSDWFSIELESETLYRFDVEPTTAGLLQPGLTLRDVDGNIVDVDSGDSLFGRDAVIVNFVDSSGPYFLDVAAVEFSGPYEITSSILGTLEAGLEVGELYSQSLERFDEHFYTIQLEAGIYQFDVVGADGFDPRLSLMDPSFDRVARNDDIDFPANLDSRIIAPVSTGGDYRLVVEAPWNSGSYQITTQLVADFPTDVSGDTATTGELVIGASPQLGALDEAGDSDWFGVELMEGRFYEIDLVSWDGAMDPFLTVYGADGNLLAVNDDYDFPENKDSKIYFSPTESGTFYVASDAVYDSVGLYQISVAEIAAFPDDYSSDSSTAGAITLGESIVAEHLVKGDADWFAVSLEAGQGYSVLVENPNSDGVAPVLEIYNENEMLVTSEIVEFLDSRGFSDRSYLHFVAAETATYYVATVGRDYRTGDDVPRSSFTSQRQHPDNGIVSSGTEYELTVWLDDYPDYVNATNPTPVSLVNGILESADDQDAFRLDLTAGATYSLSISSDEITELQFTMLDVDPIDPFDPIWRNADPIPFVFRAPLDSAELTVSASGDTGSYTLELNEIDVADDHGGSFADATVGTLGSIIHSRFEAALDVDYIAFELEADTIYTYELVSNTLGRQWLDVYDAYGDEVAITVNSVSHGSLRDFVVPADGTYYFRNQIDWGGYAENASDEYAIRLNVDSVSLLDTVIESNVRFDGDVISYYFVEEGYDYNAEQQLNRWDDFYSGDGYIAEGWSDYAKDQMRIALDTFESVIDIEFIEVDAMDQADLTFVNDWDLRSAGRAQVQGQKLEGLTLFELSFTEANPDSLAPGGWYHELLLHEVAHQLGLKHPHDSGPLGGNPRMVGTDLRNPTFVQPAFELNQSVYTVMSYNSGWSTAPYGRMDLASSLAEGYGSSSGLGPLDIAALQSKYAANPNFESGDNVYELSGTNEAGVGFESIWDTGGIDELSYSGSDDATINLNDATNVYERGGAGFISYADGVYGGYTIANGVIVENATSGSGNDELVGNEFDNVLRGNGGDDLLQGGAGADVLDGGDGIDTASYADAQEGVRVSLRGGHHHHSRGRGHAYGHRNAHGHGRNEDHLIDIENLIGSDFNDVLVGDHANNTLDGGSGDDRLTGGWGSDTFVARRGGNTVVTDFKNGSDVLDLTNFGITDLDSARANSTISQRGRRVRMSFDDGEVVIIHGLRHSQLDDSDFVSDGVGLGEVPANPDTFALLEVGETIRSSIEAPGDHDWFAIDLKAGVEYEFNVSNVDANSFPTMVVRNSSGEQLEFEFRRSASRGRRILFTAPSDGRYYLDVDGLGSYSVGGYEISAAEYDATQDDYAEYDLTGGLARLLQQLRLWERA